MSAAPGGRGGCLGCLLVFAVLGLLSLAPSVVLVALAVHTLLRLRWPDRLLAWALVGVFGTGTVLLLWLWERPAGVVWVRMFWTRTATSEDLWHLGVIGIVYGPALGAFWWLVRQKMRERDLYEGPDVLRERRDVEEKRRRWVTQRAQKVSRTTSSPALRRVVEPLAVPLGDARGPFLGVYQHGNLGGRRVEVHRRAEDRLWRAGRAVRLPLGAGSPVQHVVVLGATGVGKTESTLRLCEWALSEGWQVIYLSAKEPPTREDAAAPRLTPLADRLARDSRVLVQNRSPFDAMRGSAEDVRDRLVAIEQWGEPYWEHVANLLLAIALETGDPIGGLPDLVTSLTPSRLTAQAAISGDPRVQDVVAAMGDRDLAGAMTRYASLAVSLRGWLGVADGNISRGDSAAASAGRQDLSSGWSWEDADLCVAELPTGTRPKAGRALMRVMVRDLGAYLFDPARRRQVDGKRQRCLLVVEEVGALAADPVVGPEFVNLVERARAADAVCVLTAQDPLGLGDDRVQSAVLTNAATLSYRQTTQAEAVAQLAGTVRVDEASRSYDAVGLGSAGSTRRQYAMALNPQELRSLRLGEAAVIHGGKFATLAAVPTDSLYRTPEPVSAPERPAVTAWEPRGAVGAAEGPVSPYGPAPGALTTGLDAGQGYSDRQAPGLGAQGWQQPDDRDEGGGAWS